MDECLLWIIDTHRMKMIEVYSTCESFNIELH